MARKPRTYDREFKLAAVERAAEGRPLAHVAREIGIHPSTLRRWRSQLPDAPEAQGSAGSDESEVARLRHELERVTRERDRALEALGHGPRREPRAAAQDDAQGELPFECEPGHPRPAPEGAGCPPAGPTAPPERSRPAAGPRLLTIDELVGDEDSPTTARPPPAAAREVPAQAGGETPVKADTATTRDDPPAPAPPRPAEQGTAPVTATTVQPVRSAAPRPPAAMASAPSAATRETTAPPHEHARSIGRSTAVAGALAIAVAVAALLLPGRPTQDEGPRTAAPGGAQARPAATPSGLRPPASERPGVELAEQAPPPPPDPSPWPDAPPVPPTEPARVTSEPPPPADLEAQVAALLDELIQQEDTRLQEDALARLADLGPQYAGPEVLRQLNRRRRGTRTDPRLREAWRRAQEALCTRAERDRSAGPPPAELGCRTTAD